jgi:ubiquinone/menaquinone biosynthesis C-methylase UbiE
VARGKKFAEDMRELVRGITAKTFLDIGCGQGDITGELLAILAEENPDIIGMGIDNKTEILKSKWKDNLAFWWGDIFDNEIPDASVDVIFAGYILQVLDAKGRMKLFDEIDRILAPGGTVIFLEVIDQGKKRNRVNELKHRVLNLFTPYLVMGEDEWVRYIERNGRGLIVWEKAKVGSRSKAFKARMKDY